MLASNRPTRPVSSSIATASCLILGLILTSRLEAELIRIRFQTSGGEARAIHCPGNRTMVSVFSGPGKLEGAVWMNSKGEKNLPLLGHDTITRLCFFENPGMSPPTSHAWKPFFQGRNPENLVAIGLNDRENCQFRAWVNQINDKVLPLALMQVAFTAKIPPAGTPLVDSNNQIVGLVLQAATGNSAYVIPSQAVHRVHKDITAHRKLVRGWIGISLSTNSNVPRITRVWPGSPAEKADIKPDDILLKAGPFTTGNYPEAVNALFYTKPGETTALEIRRSDRTIPCKLVPMAEKPGS